MHTPPSGRPAEWFPSSVTLKGHGPYQAEVLGHRCHRTALPRFTADVARHIAAEFAATIGIRLTDGNVEILGPGEPPKVLERCRPDAAAATPWATPFCPGASTPPPTPRSSPAPSPRRRPADTRRRHSMRGRVTFADHGHRMAVLAVYRTPDEDAAAYDALYNVLYASGLSPYETSSASADDAELAARRRFSSQRAHLAPDTVVWPKVAVATRLSAGPR